MSKRGKITQRALASHWGCSQPYVSKCVQKGCPTHSFEAADQWREAHTKRR